MIVNDKSLFQIVIIFLNKQVVCKWDCMMILYENMSLEHFC